MDSGENVLEGCSVQKITHLLLRLEDTRDTEQKGLQHGHQTLFEAFVIRDRNTNDSILSGRANSSQAVSCVGRGRLDLPVRCFD